MGRVYILIVVALVIGLVAGLVIGKVIAVPEQGATCLVKAGKFANPPPGTKYKVIVGIDPNYPPFAYVLPNGTIVGFDIDVLKRIGEICGFEPVFKPWDWATIIEALLRGDIDLIASGMTVNAPRSERVWFTIPYYTYTYYVVTRANDNRSLEEVLNSGEYIAVQTGSTADMLADELLKKGYNFKKLGLESYPAALEAVVTGKAAGIFDSAFLIPYLKQHPDLASEVRIVGEIGPVRTYAYATRPGDKWLRDCINKALEQLMFSPEWDELLRKWGLRG